MNRFTVLLSLAGFVGLSWLGSGRVLAQECRVAHVPAAAQEFHEGATVVVTTHADLMVGSNVVGHVAPGQELHVTKVRDGWLGTSVEVNGARKNGWLWGGFAADRAAAAVASQPRTYRSFSYEPETNSVPAAVNPPRAAYPRGQGAYRSGGNRGSSRGSGKPLYLLPKGDPRKSGGR